MNDGKPTKAKWWSRPRPPVAPGDAGAGPSDGARIPEAEGDFELQRPHGIGASAAPAVKADGDFELAGPSQYSGEDAVAGGAGAGAGEDSTASGMGGDGDPVGSGMGGGGDPVGSGMGGDGDPVGSGMGGEGDPVGSAVDGHGASTAPVENTDGDFELAGPTEAHRGGERDGNSAGLPGDRAAGSSADRPVGLPGDRIAGSRADRPASLLGDCAVDSPAELPASPPGDRAVGPADQPASPPADRAADSPVDQPASPSVDHPAGSPADRPVAPPAGHPSDLPAALSPDPSPEHPSDPLPNRPSDPPPNGPSDPPPHALPADEPPADRPTPLHDPDPYSTPPYGEPGPWASAPPVQHPAATPAHGTHVPTAPLTDPAPPLPTPAHGVHEPATSVPAPALWQNYDPWAAPGPLQQNGAVVVSKAQQIRRAKKALVAGAVLIALVSGGVGGVVGVYLERNGGVSDVELPQAGKEAPGRAPDSVAGIAAQALPSVVTLHVSGSEQEGTGTGFVLDGQGHILTNNHVVEPAADGGDISVTFSSGDTAEAKVVGRDSGYDLAVVRVSGVSGLDPVPLGNSDNVQVGDPVVAIGAPFDLANTVTSGIISAKERPITAGGESGDGSDVSYVDALQTDAPINPGNSGGPLLDSSARVIGINSAIRSADNDSGLETGQSGSIGLGFAIPINQAKRVAEEIINTGKATHPVIGVTLDMEYAGDGAKVGTQGGDGGPAVTAGGPGARAGIKAGDIITEVDGRRVHSGEELIVRIRAHRPGDTLRLTLLRGGTEEQLTLVLGSADSD